MKRQRAGEPTLLYDSSMCLICGGIAWRRFDAREVPELFKYLFQSMSRADFVAAVVGRLQPRGCVTAPLCGVSVCAAEMPATLAAARAPLFLTAPKEDPNP